jgi:3'-phosphoadenosine 5'-phosphosulfate sulfotransferase (PAPS reductase)/FAD synthetase/ribosomal protein L35
MTNLTRNLESIKVIKFLRVINPYFKAPFFPVLNIVSVSGGKDSAATLLRAIECKAPNLLAVFADTGNEHSITYEYVRYLEEQTGVPITWLKADFSKQIEEKRQFVANDMRFGRKYKTKPVFDIHGNPVWKRTGTGEIVYKEENKNGVLTKKPVQKTVKVGGGHKVRWSNKAKRSALSILFPTGNAFLDLCIWKGRFPSTKARFCSTELKREVILYKLQFPLVDQGFKIISWQGVRADESLDRSKLPTSDNIGDGVTNYRPILKWSASDCFDMHKKHNLEPNPLYKMGMGRVGCMPCIHCNKAELRAIADRFPEEINRIEDWERMVGAASRRGSATLFTSDKRGHGIRELVEWSKTTRGGKHYDLIPLTEDTTSCSSIYGLCE